MVNSNDRETMCVRLDEPPSEVHQGRTNLRPYGPTLGTPAKLEPTGSAAIGIRAGFLILLLLIGMLVATRAFMTVFVATVQATSRALPMGSLTAPRRDAAHAALVRELDRRREALVVYDRQIAVTVGDPLLQAAWRNLKQGEVEAVKQLERRLNQIHQAHSLPTAGQGQTPPLNREETR